MAIKDDSFYMQEALLLAQKAGEEGEVPIGALVVSPQGAIIGCGWNRIEGGHCQDQHAELIAIRQACAFIGDWRLDGCTLFVTLEPCLMCIGCITLSRMERLVYAAASPQYGYRGRRDDLCRLYSKTLGNVTEGVCREEAERLLKNFFKERR